MRDENDLYLADHLAALAETHANLVFVPVLSEPAGENTRRTGFVHEAVVQLRGDADQRQVAGAEVAVTSSGGGHPGGAILFTTDRG